MVERERPRPRDRDERREGASWARLLAPVAFFAAATTLILIVHNSLQARPDEPQPRAPTTRTTTGARGAGATQTSTTTPARQRRVHRVQSGDTLESIAARYNTSVEDLLELNPDIDPLALSPGQRIRVR